MENAGKYSATDGEEFLYSMSLKIYDGALVEAGLHGQNGQGNGHDLEDERVT